MKKRSRTTTAKRPSDDAPPVTFRLEDESKRAALDNIASGYAKANRSTIINAAIDNFLATFAVANEEERLKLIHRARSRDVMQMLKRADKVSARMRHVPDAPSRDATA